MREIIEQYLSLTPKQQKLLEKQLKKDGIDIIQLLAAQKDEDNSIQPVAKQDYYPMSLVQRRFYFFSQIERVDISYDVFGAVTIEGALDLERLDRVFQTLVARHEALRTSFNTINGEPVQKVHSDAPFQLDVMEAKEEELKQVVHSYIKPFDLQVAPLFRVGAVKISPQKHVLIFDMHHIISDGVSIGVLTREFILLYNGDNLPELSLQYKDFAVWQDRQFKLGIIKKQEEYWLSRFAGELPTLNLPLDYPRPAIQNFEGERIVFALAPELMKDIDHFITDTGVTFYMFLLTAFTVLLSKYTGQEDIVIGSPVVGRRHKNLENIIGVFINTLAMRNYPEGKKTFKEFLKETKENTLKAFDNQDYPFEELVDQLKIKRNLSRNPLFDVVFAVQNPRIEQSRIAGLTFKPYELEVKNAMFDLTLNVISKPSTPEFHLEYCTRLFKRETIERLKGHFINLLVEVVRTDRPLQELEILTSAEKQWLLEGINVTDTEWPKEKTLTTLWMEQFRRTPEKIAVVSGDQVITYQQLAQKSEALARILREKGVGPDRIVGIMMERSINMIIGTIAVLHAGGVYLPIDPHYPVDRIVFMLEDSGARVLLTQGDFAETISFDGETINMDRAGLYDETSKLTLEPMNQPGDMAYIIYTSGTTGRPKGVMIEHRNVVRLFYHDRMQFDFSEFDVWTMFHSFCFDFSVWEMYGALLYGGKLIVVPQETVRDPKEFLSILKREQVTVLNQTPSAFYQLINEELKDGTKELCLRYIIFGGEALKPLMLKDWRTKYPQIRLINMYGITETTVHVTFKEITEVEIEQGISNIGKPIPTLTVYILDRNQRLVPTGVAGELCVGGDGVARGYLNRPELTVEKFIRNPYRPEERLYRSGDLARLMENGEMEYLGRIDQQVKIRGHRIELGEIETRLLQHESVQEAVVVVREDMSGDKFLRAYIVLEKPLSIQELRGHMAAKLPEYMIPSSFVPLTELPLTSNGKIDRKNLPEPEEGLDSGVVYVEPRGETEEKIAAIWREILGLEKIGRDDSFFELGGHSLKATILIARIHKEFQVKVSLIEVFRCSDLKSLAEIVSNAERNTYTAITPVEAKEYYSVSSSQKRLYILDQMEGVGTAYNITSVTIIEGYLDRRRIEYAFQVLTNRHESLRTSFEIIDEEPVQRIHQDLLFHINYLEVGADLEDTLQTFIRPFCLAQPPLWRVGLIELNSEKHVLVCDLHHIIADGTSLRVMIDEFMQIYNGESLAELRIQYKDFSEWQNRLMQSESSIIKRQEEYWVQLYSGEIPVLNLPTDFSRPAVQNFSGKKTSFGLDKKLTNQIHQFLVKSGKTLYMFLLAVYNTFLGRITGQEDIIIGSPIAGRHHVDLENIIGLFVNTLAMRNYPQVQKTFMDFLEEVQYNALKAFENQDYQFEHLVEKIRLRRDLSRNPLFDTLFALHNQNSESLKLQYLRFLPYEMKVRETKFDLTLYAVEQDGEIIFRLEYSPNLFKDETVFAFSEYFHFIIHQVISNPLIMLGDIDLLTAKEKETIISNCNGAKAHFPREKSISQLFEIQCLKAPGQIAVVLREQKISYDQLNKKANRIARALVIRGVNQDSIVGIMVERSFEMIAGILGILKAGAAYLPIDPGSGDERIRYFLRDSRVSVLLTKSEWRRRFLLQEVLLLDDEESYPVHDSNLEIKVDGHNPAYVIYTSGSTGEPKGVLIEHYTVVNRLTWMQSRYPIGPSDIILHKTPFTFDVSVWEIFWWGWVGAGVCLLTPGGEKDPAEIIDTICDQKVTTIHFVPSMLNSFLHYLEEHEQKRKKLSGLRRVFTSGEALQPSQVNRFNRLFYSSFGSTLHNLYGPTEATVDVSYYDCPGGKDCSIVPIGRPIDNISLYVLDSQYRPQPYGVPGELYIAGEGLARGYINKPDLTGEKFVPNPFVPGVRMYRTGDIAKILPDGNILFLGRRDYQVKIRGNRIELGEIETQLAKHPSIRETVVTTWDDKDGEKYLCAYIVPNEQLAIKELRGFLARDLPDYMIPSDFISMDKFPLNSSGKVDRKALPKPEERLSEDESYIAPSNETEQKLVNIWEEILGVQQIGIRDNFFVLGGHSLKATLLVSRIYRYFKIDVPFKIIFQYPTIQELSEWIHSARKKEYITIPIAQKKDYYRVSSAQGRFYFLHELSGSKTDYNMPGFKLIKGDLKRESLQYALNQIIKRHEVLRTSFLMLDGELAQHVHNHVELELDYYEILQKLPKDRDDEIRRIIREFHKPFDLKKAPLLRTGLVRISVMEYLFMYDIHHIISDAISMDIFIHDLMCMYFGKELPDLKVQYKDFAEWQNDLLRSKEIKQQEEYWLQQFAEGVPEINLAIDKSRDNINDYTAASIHFHVEPIVSDKLHQLAENNNSSLYMVLLSGFIVLLSKYSGQTDIVVGTPVAGRTDMALENLMGLFINTLPIRSRLGMDNTFHQLLMEVKRNLLDAFENQNYQIEELVKKLKLHTRNRNPLFDTLFLLQNQSKNLFFETNDLEITDYPYVIQTTTVYDLFMIASDGSEGISIYLQYLVELFGHERINNLVQHFCNILAQIVKDPEMTIKNIKLDGGGEKNEDEMECNHKKRSDRLQAEFDF